MGVRYYDTIQLLLALIRDGLLYIGLRPNHNINLEPHSDPIPATVFY